MVNKNAPQKKRVLAIVSRLPSSFQNKRDVRFFNMLKHLSKNNTVFLMYVQSTDGEAVVRKEIERTGIEVFSVKEKRKPSIYDLDLQFKDILQAGGYDVVFFNGYYVAKYYLTYTESYLPEAVVLIDAANSLYISALEYANKVSDDVQKSMAGRSADNHKMAEIPILSHADVVIVENENVIENLRESLRNVEFKTIGSGDVAADKGSVLEELRKKAMGPSPAIDVFLLDVVNEGEGNSAEKANVELLNRYPNVNYRKVSGTSTAECFNKAIKEVRGEYSAFFGNNTLLNSRTLADLSFCALINSAIGIVYPASNVSTGVNVDPKQIDGFIAKHYKANMGYWREAKSVPGELFLMNNKLLGAIGTMDERFRTRYFALYDYCLRAFQANYSTIEVNEAFVYYTGMEQTGKDGERLDRKLLLSKWADKGTEFLERLV